MKISREVLQVFDNDLSVEENRVKIIRPLERRLYEKVNQALEAAGGKWNRQAKAHVFMEWPLMLSPELSRANLLASALSE